jgi:hypothetical protein
MDMISFKSDLRKFYGPTIIALLVAASLLMPLLNLIAPVHGATTVLTPKWARTTGLGSNCEGGMVIGDINDDGLEEIVYAGYSYSTPSSRHISVLDGDTGDVIATWYSTRIGDYCQPQLYDVDGDGVLDILVPLFYLPGLAAVQYDGTSTLRTMWTANTQGSGGSGSVMAKPVAGDIDGDGHLDIFIASQDVSPGDNSTGTYHPNGYDGTICRINDEGDIVATTFTWRACSGGLSLADTDNDGIFELYQGDRDMDYSDGGYGKGAKSYWADNLTERWIRLDDLTSSQAPVLVDVNGDGIKEALVGMYHCVWILNSTNGQAIQYWSDNSLSDHYGFTIYDIDGDGHLEVLTNDGDHDDQPYTDVFDLVTGEMDAQLYHGGQLLCTDENYLDGSEYNHLLGTAKWSPLVADIDPTHPGMEIISTPEGTGLDGGQWWNGAIMIWSSSYESLQNVTRRPGSTPGTYSTTRLGAQLSYPIVQDIDGDGLLELVVRTSTGHAYAFDTSAPAPGYNQVALPGSERIRSEVTYYGEDRLGVAQHTIAPWEEDYWTAPLVAPISPSDNGLAVPISTTQLSFKLREHQSESLDCFVTTSPDVGSDSGSIGSGTYDWNTRTVDITGLDYDTTYTWTVSATDGTYWTNRTYTFRTELAPNPGNHAPTQDTPSLVSQDGLNTTTSTFECSSQSTGDSDGDNVTNIYKWIVNGDSLAQLLLPFDTRDETSTTDYSGYGNDGVVKGATWVPNGIVGGAYSFDGKDDAIIISDGGAGYFNDVDYNSGPLANHEELGGYGNWYGITVEAWVYLTEYTNGSRIVAKIPSYALGFESHRTSRLYAAVWPYSGVIADDDNQATVDRMQEVYADVDIELNTWYHIAFTYESGVGIKLYFDGELVAQSRAYEGPLSPSRGEPVYIGRLVQPFAGMIDDVRVYSYAQPAEQIYNYYMGTKDGNSSSSLFIPLGIANPGDTLECEVIPTDSFEEGDTATSAPITILNSAPVASNLQIYPIRARDFRLGNENLDASYEYFDPDGNAEQNSEIRWYRNGVLQPAFNDNPMVTAGSTSSGDEWYFTVRPRDSLGAYGDMQTSYNVTIYENTPPSTDTPLLVSSAGTDFDDEDLIASAQGTSDSDGNSVTNIYHWINGGTSLTNLQMAFDTETPLYLNGNGTTEDYSGYGNDGTVVGAEWVEDGVVGGGYYFDGHDYIRVEESGDSLGGDGSWSEISVEFWVKAPSGTTSNEHAIVKHDLDFSTGGGGYGGSSSSYGVGYMVDFRARGSRNQVTWYIYTSDQANSTSFQLYDDPAGWHHVVCTYESGVGLKIYMDGLLRASLLNATLIGNINATLDGILDVGGYGSGSTDFSGTLDEVRIYPFALSAAQIFQRFIETKDGLSDSSTIVAQETLPGENWVCEVIPNDSWEDGTAQDSNTLHVNPVIGNSQPRIDVYSPANFTVEVNEGESLNFTQSSSDPDNDTLTYSWLLDGIEQAVTQNWTYSPGLGDAGTYNVTLVVSDGELFDSQEWNVTVVAAGEQYELTIIVVGNGTTVPAAGSHMYAAGTEVDLTAYADLGWVFSDWTGDLTSTNSSESILMDENKTVTATFVMEEYTLNINIIGNGTIDLNVTGPYYYGDLVELTATPDLGWNFFEWDGDLTGSANPTTIVMDGNKTVNATFVEVASGGKGQLVVRGADNRIYYRIYNSSSDFWEDWNVVSDGATCDSPAAAVYSGRLYFVVRGMDGYSIWFGFVNLTDHSFSGWELLSGATPSAPTLTSYGSKLILVVRGFTNMIYYRSYDTVSDVWNDWIAVPDGATCDSPAAAVLGTDLHLVVRGFSTTDVSGNSTLWHGTVNLGDDSFSGWTRLSGATPSAPTLAASETLGSLYLSVRGMSDVIWINTWNGSAWEGWNALPNGATCDSPAIAVVNGELHFVVRSINGDALWHYYIDLDTNAHSGWILIDGWTSSAPTLCS